MVSLRRTVQYAILTLPTGYCVEKVIGHEMLGEGRAQLLPVAVLIAAYLFDRIAEPRWPGYRVRLAESARAKWVGWVPSLALGVVLAEPTAVLVAYGAWLHPIGFAGLVVLIALALVFQWRNRSIWPERARIDPVAVALMLGYAGIASYGYVAYGASESDCRRIEASEYMRPILARAQFVERGEEWACTPDALGIDAAADRLIFTLKRWNRGPGRGNTATDIPSDAVGSLSLSDPLFRADRLIRVGDEEEGASPGRIAVNPDRSEVYVIVHGDEGHHGVWIFNYANGLNVRRVVPLPFEPTDVRFDDQRLIIAAGEGAVATFALDS
ncbi:MAG: hypothetical protein KJ042_16285, partial [Deltaproteobacteria bacterium]|nr:hypothetical protein [Deltaproteobacteria bacterium]